MLISTGVNQFAIAANCGCETQYSTVVDAIHAAWPDARVWIMRPWKRGWDSTADQWATGIANVVSTRTTWLHEGPDERSWLKGSDNGDTMTWFPAPDPDGIHYNTAGETECSAQWFTALGY